MTTSSQKRIFIIDDDPKLVITLLYQLESLGFDIVSTGDGTKVWDMYHKFGPFSVIVLDVHLQGKDGFSILKEIRKIDQHTGILMLTARNSDIDKVRGLRFGADDYLCKPFNQEELITRISRIASRSELIGTPRHFSDKINFGDFTLDREHLTLYSPSKGTQELTLLEVDLLSAFIESSGKVLSRHFLLQKVWGVKGDVETRTVDNFIVKLRKFIEDDASNPQHIISIRGRGYKFQP